MSPHVWLATPAPTPGGQLDAYDVSPGLLGFLVTFAVVVVLIALLVSMTRKLRRLKHNAEAGREAETPPPTADPSGPRSP
ncbi:hypothetical protein Q6348_06515 [Isoptericola sp. b441]|uniref:Uncharacterized protein n=1 Tax=Actinotalea lenta TaxID=3064654 RepID=A0ABT9D7L3_9CELL|nr:MULTISPECIES: hypothetical protein [unclassified Isoptericola]MDO8106848.1 hypothetical protein [Isoptericola sp. b441]MDO8121441.1 hypothetical protein [Isoptericola sp. b490]